MKKGKEASSLFLVLAALFFIIPIAFSVAVGDYHVLLSTRSAIFVLLSTMCIIISAILREKAKKIKRTKVVIKTDYKKEDYDENDYDLCV